MDIEQLVSNASRARRLACGLNNLKDVRALLAYAKECEIAAALAQYGQLRFEDVERLSHPRH